MSLLDPNGKPIIPDSEQFCPKCGRGPKQRVPSGGFGETYYVCVCGYDFERKLKCQSITP